MSNSLSSKQLALATCLAVAAASNSGQAPSGPGAVPHGPAELLGSYFGYIDIPKTFDYVIVGGGTAGLVVAERLASNGSFSVAVVEAGGFYEVDNGNFSQIPGFASQYTQATTTKNPLIDWYQSTTAQPGLNNRSLFYTQGKTLGGGSARNSMFFQRGSKGTYDKWAEAVGDDSYTFENLLPFFKRSVQFNALTPDARPANATPKYDPTVFSPSGGPLQISYPKWVTPAAPFLAKGYESIGLRQVRGFSDGDLLGWSFNTYTIDPRSTTRSSSQSSFMQLSLTKGTNLNYYKSTLAKKILFDDQKRATGVQVDTAGVQYTLSAAREVILSAGAFRSPQLLMVSGVGPAEVLSKFNITQIADLPGVGQNLRDNLFSGPSFPVRTRGINNPPDAAYLSAAIDAYNKDRQGPLTNGGSDVAAFEKLPSEFLKESTRQDLDSAFGKDWPDIELLPLNAFFADSSYSPAPETSYLTLLSGLTAAFSTGNVTINSTDTAVHPIVNPKWLSDPRDEEMAIAGFKRARAVLNSPAFAPFVIGNETFPGANVRSDEAILKAIRESGVMIWHACATNKMGRKEDRMAVVNSRASVMGGVRGLRVVDASAMPFLPPGQPQGSIYMLAEKISQDILDGYL